MAVIGQEPPKVTLSRASIESYLIHALDAPQTALQPLTLSLRGLADLDECDLENQGGVWGNAAISGTFFTVR